MKKDKVIHLSHNPQRLSFTPSSPAKLPLASDAVLSKQFEAALKLAGTTVNACPIPTDKNLFATNHLLGELSFSSMDDHLCSLGINQTSTVVQDKARLKQSITTEVTTNACQRQIYDNTPCSIIVNIAATKTVNNDKLTTQSTAKHKQPRAHLVN